MSINRTHEGWPVEPVEPGLPKTKPEVIAYVVFRTANLIESVIRSTPQLARSIILLWSMTVPVVVLMWAGHHIGIRIDGNTWYAQWCAWVTVGGSGTLAISARGLPRRLHRRKGGGRPPPVRTAAGRHGPETPDNGEGSDRKGTPRED